MSLGKAEHLFAALMCGAPLEQAALPGVESLCTVVTPQRHTMPDGVTLDRYAKRLFLHERGTLRSELAGSRHLPIQGGLADVKLPGEDQLTPYRLGFHAGRVHVFAPKCKNLVVNDLVENTIYNMAVTSPDEFSQGVRDGIEDAAGRVHDIEANDKRFCTYAVSLYGLEGKEFATYLMDEKTWLKSR